MRIHTWLKAPCAALIFILLGGCVENAMYTKPNVRLSDLEQDTARCKELARTVQHNPGGPVPLNLAQGVGFLIGSAVSGEFENSEHQRLTGQCLEMRGYLRRAVSEEVVAAYERLPGEKEKEQFLHDLAQDTGSKKK